MPGKALLSTSRRCDSPKLFFWSIQAAAERRQDTPDGLLRAIKYEGRRRLESRCESLSTGSAAARLKGMTEMWLAGEKGTYVTKGKSPGIQTKKTTTKCEKVMLMMKQEERQGKYEEKKRTTRKRKKKIMVMNRKKDMTLGEFIEEEEKEGEEEVIVDMITKTTGLSSSSSTTMTPGCHPTTTT
ncbi:unnamed protein product [Heligmosomoides polygyrus]|uniref:Uncharacterized protein n=1 Tax=Heligmosomoides polygyrus TaxID=6339 RepID=A0A183FDB5_HELPZ|nr:unnamed protein product [Heligmosomoides polygyrus]